MAAYYRAVIATPLLLIFAACGGSDSKKAASAADASAPVWTLSTRSDEARQHIEQGERAFDQGRFTKAYEQFKRAVAADSAFAYGYLRVAQTGQSLDEYRVNLQRAAAYESTANETERTLIDIEQKGFAHDQQGALDLAKQLTQKQAGNPRSWWNLSFLQSNAGDIAGSRESLRKAVGLAPQYGASHLFYGSGFITPPRDLQSAEKHILEGGKLWPNEPLSYDYLGDVRRAQGRLDEAAKAYGRQIELDPQEAEGHSQRGHAYTFTGKYDQARADYDAAIRLSKDNGPAGYGRYRAYVSAYAGDFDTSLKELNELYEATDGMKIPNPDGAKLATLEAESVIALYAGKFDIADRAYSQAVPLQMKAADRVGTPEFRRGVQAGIAYDKGRIAAFKGDFATAESAIADINKLVEQDRNPNKYWPVHELRGWVAFFRKQYDQSAREFEQGGPQRPWLWYYHARALEGAGKTAEAKALFKQIANLNFNTPGYAAVRRDAIARAQ